MTAVEDLCGAILGLFIGEPQVLWPGKLLSAIRKRSIDGPVALDAGGLAGDQQADLTVHGGPEKAVHHYAAEHMAFWKAMFPDHAQTFAPGCFGENVSTTGLVEEAVCIGDVFSMGSARVQICQGRQPCWKLSAHIGLPEMAAQFQLTGRTGWYYRVLEGGSVAPGAEMRLLDRAHPGFSVHAITQARFDRRLDPRRAKEIAGLAALSANWRAAFVKKSDRGYREDTRARLSGD